MAKRLNIVKKFLYLPAVFALALAFAGCAEYTPPTGDGGGNNPSVTDPEEPQSPVTPSEEEDGFTVSLEWVAIDASRSDFTKSDYSKINSLQAQWTDKSTGEVFRASFNDDGVASAADLDGDYAVTLVTVPDGFTYNPNIYAVSNDAKAVAVTLYQLSPASSGGNYQGTPYYQINTTGAYKVTLADADDSVMFYFKPSRQGSYTLESLVDITANEINPILEIRYGNLPAYMNPYGTKQDGGGSENTYTKNFKWEYGIYGDEVGNGLIFIISSEARNADAYGSDGMELCFILDRDGDFTRGDNDYTVVEAAEDFAKWENDGNKAPTPSGTFIYCANRPGVVNHILDQTAVKLYAEEDGGDGYYHYYDALTGEYGALLYAKIDGSCEVLEGGFTNPLVTLYNVNGYDYRAFVSAYVAHCNDDGCYPVTEELRVFLQNFATYQRYFDDGNGWAETNTNYNSDEDSQWMFACGYYS